MLMMRATKSKTDNSISEVTRRNLMDQLSAERVVWSGRMAEPVFLGRIWDLSKLPSDDYRFSDAEGDIRQHRINNWDWDEDWIFHDHRFNLVGCPDEVFLHFLSEMLHPVVRSNEEEVNELLDTINGHLAVDGWELAGVSVLSGRTVYDGRRRDLRNGPIEAVDIDAYPRLDSPEVLREHLARIERTINSDPASAIASAKELLESVAKQILDDYGRKYKDGDSLTDLYRGVQDVLDLNAESVPGDKKGSQAAVKTLRALVTTVQGLAELRNSVGLGHGRTKTSSARPRHAHLALNASISVTQFLLDTWHERRADTTEEIKAARISAR